MGEGRGEGRRGSIDAFPLQFIPRFLQFVTQASPGHPGRPRLRLHKNSESLSMPLKTVLALVLSFRSSSALAAAYGFAVTATMVLTSVIMGFVIFHIWRVRRIWMYLLFAMLAAFDLALFGASATKIPDGAWLPPVVPP